MREARRALVSREPKPSKAADDSPMNRLATPAQRRTGFRRWALILAPLVLLLGMASGYVSGSGAENPWFAALEKPALYPPPVLFPIVWTLLYLMMGAALALVLAARPSRVRLRATLAFVVQFALNLAWSPVFFAAHQLVWALVVILALDVALLATIALFARVDRRAAWLLVPYLAWALFATGLNWQLWVDNPQAEATSGPVVGAMAA